MFSEREIIIHCRQCKGQCGRIKKCPFKMIRPIDQKSSLFPVIPADWEFSGSAQCISSLSGDRYTTEQLLTGLSKLNGHL